jgi:hypothetical protein
LDYNQRKVKATLVEIWFATDRATFAAHERCNVEEALDFDSLMLQQRANEAYDPDSDVNKLVG